MVGTWNSPKWSPLGPDSFDFYFFNDFFLCITGYNHRLNCIVKIGGREWKRTNTIPKLNLFCFFLCILDLGWQHVQIILYSFEYWSCQFIWIVSSCSQIVLPLGTNLIYWEECGWGGGGIVSIVFTLQDGRKEMFYLMTHSTHYIYGCMVSDIW